MKSQTRSLLPVAAAALLTALPATAQTNEPRFPVKQDGKYGYINASGGLVVSPKYLSADDFSEGLAMVRAVTV